MVKLAIVGRPNVGKSTLFNRLAGRKLALVDDRPGVTRDRRFGTGRLGDLDLELIDTAGFEDVTDESLEARMRRQTERALDEADVALFVFDAREGVTPMDRTFGELLRRRGKPVILVALGSPYLLRSFPTAGAYLATYSTVAPSETAAVGALFGEVPIQGRLPVTIPGLAKYGDGIQLAARPAAPANSPTPANSSVPAKQ